MTQTTHKCKKRTARNHQQVNKRNHSFQNQNKNTVNISETINQFISDNKMNITNHQL